MVLDLGCKFRDRGSIQGECQIPRDVDLEQVNFAIATVASSKISNTLLRRSPSTSIHIIKPIVQKYLTRINNILSFPLSSLLTTNLTF